MHIDISNFGEHLDYSDAFENIRYGGIMQANKNIVLKIIQYIPGGWIINF